jgi:hypothetical protein
MYILCIDPGQSRGTGGTGYALFKHDITDPKKKEYLIPEKTGILKSRKVSWEERVDDLIDQLETLLVTLDINDIGDTNTLFPWLDCYIELPNYFQSAKGQLCATGQNGDDSSLVKLATYVGELRRMLLCLGCRSVTYVRINGAEGWKGTMKKPAVASRIARRLNDVLPSNSHLVRKGTKEEPTLCTGTTEVVIYSSHCIDSIGIGLWVKKVFQPNSTEKEQE